MSLFRFPTPGTDLRFQTPGVDERFPSPGEDLRFPSPGLDREYMGADTPYKGGGAFSATRSVLGAGGANYALFDSGTLSTLFQDSAGTTPVTANGQPVGRAVAVQKPPFVAVQTSTGARATQGTAGFGFDAVDDNLLTDWLMAADVNCILTQFTLPASQAANQTVCGQDSASGRLSLYTTATGLVQARLPGGGAVSALNNKAGQQVFAMLVTQSSNATLYLDDQTPVSLAFTGGIATNLASRIGCVNSSAGAAANYFGGSVKRVAFGLVVPTAQQYAQIKAEWLSAP